RRPIESVCDGTGLARYSSRIRAYPSLGKASASASGKEPSEDRKLTSFQLQRGSRSATAHRSPARGAWPALQGTGRRATPQNPHTSHATLRTARGRLPFVWV